MARKQRKACRCLIKGCEKEAVRRGLCWTDFHAARAKIEAGEVTEAKLIQLNLMLPSRQGRRPNPPKFDRQLAAALAAK